MGQAKRRRQQLGDLYGTPEGSNRPAIAQAARPHDREGHARSPDEIEQHLQQVLVTAQATGLRDWEDRVRLPDEIEQRLRQELMPPRRPLLAGVDCEAQYASNRRAWISFAAARIASQTNLRDFIRARLIAEGHQLVDVEGSDDPDQQAAPPL